MIVMFLKGDSFLKFKFMFDVHQKNAVKGDCRGSALNFSYVLSLILDNNDEAFLLRL
jgi:hypothetical protein